MRAWSKASGGVLAGSVTRTAARVVAGPRHARGRAHEHDADGVAARVARRVRIDAEQSRQAHVETGFLAHLATRRVFDRFADVDEAARQRMPERRPAPLDQHDRPSRTIQEFDHDVDRDRRGAWASPSARAAGRGAQRVRRAAPR